MALLFSAVTVTAGEDEIELLVGGIPREYDDLEGWSEFDDLMCFISEETEVSVRAEAYLYGEGESMRASPEEIDDLMQRMKDDTGFLNRCCSNLESVNFTFIWSPEELFDMPFGQMLCAYKERKGGEDIQGKRQGKSGEQMAAEPDAPRFYFVVYGR